MAATPLPTQAYLRECFDYDPHSGSLTWRERPASHFRNALRSRAFNKQFSGKPAISSVSGNGYPHGMLDMVGVKAHRVIWKWMTGEDPDQIDHINGVRKDNSWTNLRNVDYPENGKNLARASNNTTGITGVYRMTGRPQWRAAIKISGKNVHLGTFPNPLEAAAARKVAEARYGFHPNHGRAPCQM